MKKCVVTLNINNYAPEIMKITQPYLKRWAKKLNADYKVITKRKYPDKLYNSEKFQLYELSENYDWTIFVDADAIITQDMPDITEVVEKKAVVTAKKDFAPLRFKYDKYFRRHEIHHGAGTWFVMCSNWTNDVWKPVEKQDDITYEQAIKNITVTTAEKNFGMKPEHLFDDYLVSRNIAKYGLKAITVKENIFPALQLHRCMHHIYLDNIEDKIAYLKLVDNKLKNLSGSINKSLSEEILIELNKFRETQNK